MEGAKRNPDTLNTIGIVTVGAVGSALVYLSIVGLQAFYVKDTAHVDELAKFGAQGQVRDTLKAEQVGNITDPRAKGVGGANNTPIYTIPISVAKNLIVRDAKVDPANLVPAIGRSVTPTVQPVFGRPKPLDAAPPAAPAPADGTAPAGGAAPAAPAAGAAPAPATTNAQGAATPTPPATTPPAPATGGQR